MNNSVTAAIFAGGESTRFGSPKANVVIDGEEFVARIARAVRGSGIERVMMIGGSRLDAARWNLEFVADETSGAGPFAALLSALHASSTRLLLTLPCDVPWIESGTCVGLSDVSPGFDVRVANSGTPQWLCSAWTKDSLPHLEQSFASGERAIHRAILGLRVEYLQLAQDRLRNINTPNDLNSGRSDHYQAPTSLNI